jgi:DME family drug/metabolite transporter
MIGYIAIAMASIIWSLNPALISRFRKYVKPIIFTAMRAVMATAFLFPLVFLNRIELPYSQPIVIVIIAISAILGPGIGDAAYTKAIQIIGGSLAVVISYTYMFIAQIIAVTLFNEKITMFLVIGTVMAFIGVVIATLENSRGSFKWIGIAYALTTSVSWGLASSMLKIALIYSDVFTLTITRIALIALFFFPIGLIFEGKPEKNSLKPLIFLATITGVLGWGVGMYLFIYSINSIGVSATTQATALTPVLSQITTKLFAGEKPSKTNIIGALMISMGIAISAIAM